MITPLLLLSAVLTLSQPPAGRAPSPSCAATVFVLQDLEKEPIVESPDQHHSVLLGVRSEDDENGWLRVYNGDRVIGTFELHNLSGGIFVKWAPDSRAFYVMWSNGGAMGGYAVRVFVVTGDGVNEVPAARRAKDDFDARYRCETRGSNAFAIQWLDGSANLLLALQLYPTGDCGKRAGIFNGYLVRIESGAILHRYSEAQLRARWPAGCPSDIYPTGFWGSQDLRDAIEQAAKKRTSGGGQ